MIEPTKPTLDVDTLARRLPRPALSADRAHAMRRALLDAVPAPRPAARWSPRSRRLVLGGVAAALAAAGALVTLAPRAPTPPGRDAAPRADVAERPSLPQVVHRAALPGPAAAPGGATAAPAVLAEGTTAFDAKQPIELARGTTTITAPAGARFEVDVQGDQIRRVAVSSGWVVVAGARAAATMVVEHQRWQLDPPPAAPSIVRAARDAAALTGPSAPPPPPPSPTGAAATPAGEHTTELAAPGPAAELPVAAPRRPSGELDFHDGLRALLTGDPHGAVDALDRACATPSSSQDDSCYWAAVAWLRSGDRPRARRGFSDLVARWPSSTHAGEANVALGWLLLDSGDRAAARARFAAAVNDRMPSVRADAQRGLAAAP